MKFRDTVVLVPELVAFAKCRHTYFKKWTGFQTKASLATSSCIGVRFVNNPDGTVADNLTGLVWEQKPTDGTVHDKENSYTWSSGIGGNMEDGTVFTTFLQTVNGGGDFAGSNGWRLPTLAQVLTILAEFPCTSTSCRCPNPCIDGTFGPTRENYYDTATSYVPTPLTRGWSPFMMGTSGGKALSTSRASSVPCAAACDRSLDPLRL